MRRKTVRLFSFILLFHFVYAATPTPTRNPSTAAHKEAAYVKDRMWGVAKDSPFSKKLSESNDGLQSVTALSNWFSMVAAGVDRRKRLTDGSECDLRNHPWPGAARNAMLDRGVDLLNTDCATSTPHREKDSRRVRELLHNVAEVFRGAGVAAMKSSLDGNWSRTYALTRWQYDSKPQSCRMERGTGMKIGDLWYVLASATNEDVRLQVPDWKREILEEYVRPHLLTAKTVFLKNVTTRQEEAFTTLHANWDGAVDISAFYQMAYTDNHPLQTALSRNEVAIDQAKDALRASNIAILAFPLLMAFFPIALIADINKWATFVYVVFTDFITAVPFVIKGIELVQIGTTETINAETWVVGKQSFQVAETWVASCRPPRDYRSAGLVFIAVGLLTICVGFALEHFARRYMRRRKELGADPQPLGPALLHMQPWFAASATFDQLPDHPMAANYAADLPPPPPTATSSFAAFYRRFVRRRHAPGSAAAAVEAMRTEDVKSRR